MLKESKTFDINKRSFYIKTFGCQMNKKDSSIIAQLLSNNGCTATQDPQIADIFIINTCSVREHAEQRALGFIAGLKTWHNRNGRIVVVVGCMAKRLADTITRKMPFVDLILGPDSYRNIGDYVDQIYAENTRIIETSLTGETYCDIYPRESDVAGFVPVTRGCNNLCSYCIVPFVRGRARSRPVSDIVKEIKHLIDGKVRDITLLGQNVNEYSYGKNHFADLLKTVAQIPGLCRLRFLTSHPKDFDEAMIEAVKSNRTICEWFHLPLQSGSNRILKLMNRRYQKDDYRELIKKIREEIPDATVTTDIIVGFPTEREEEFAETISFMKEIEFDDAYMYRYSPRQGTKAYEYESLPEDVIKRRLRKVIDLQNQIITKKTRAMVGKSYEVLFEAKAKNRATRGKTRGNKDVVVGKEIEPGTVRKVMVKEVRGRTPIGECVEAE